MVEWFHVPGRGWRRPYSGAVELPYSRGLSGTNAPPQATSLAWGFICLALSENWFMRQEILEFTRAL